jgi:tetratricopeptide (TPR) repeat protein
MNRSNETLTELNEALAQNPNDIKALAHRGETYRLKGHYEKALADFNRVIELNSDYTWALAHRGETYYLMERYKEALADFDDSVKLKPDYAWAIAHRGACYQKLNRYSQGLSDLNRAIELKPDYAWVFSYRCQMYTLMNRYEEALMDFDRALALDNSIIPYWPGERALLLSYSGCYAQAIECCEQGLNKNPNDYVTLYTFTVVKARQFELTQVDIEKTRLAVQTMLEAEKERAGALYRLGGLAALEGDREQALDYLQQAISLENEPRELARRDLAWLDLRGDTRFQSIINQKG